MLRNLLWSYIYQKEVPESLATTEIIVAIAVALLFLGLYPALKRFIFYAINDNSTNAKIGAWILSFSLAIPWVIAVLDIFGYWSAVVALAIFGCVVLIDLIYLIASRNR